MSDVRERITSRRCRQARAEAAAWLARLHGPARTAEVEQGFQDWMTADPAHARAFDRATEIWEATAAVRPGTVSRLAASHYGVTRRQTPSVALASAALLVVTAIGVGWFALRERDVVTAVGEQRVVTLTDGSRVSLNSDTRLVVDYRKDRRLVRLDRGEALFEVAKSAVRPFVVLAGAEQITAVGTTFIVRRDESRVSVTLIDGKVSVTPTLEATTVKVAQTRAQVLRPGERLTASVDVPPIVDVPRLDEVMAWRRGEVVLDNTPLADAVAEMNRYGPGTIAVDPAASNYRVSGIFRMGDTDAFVRAVADLYRLRVVQTNDRVLLAIRVDAPEHETSIPR